MCEILPASNDSFIYYSLILPDTLYSRCNNCVVFMLKGFFKSNSFHFLKLHTIITQWSPWSLERGLCIMCGLVLESEILQLRITK